MTQDLIEAGKTIIQKLNLDKPLVIFDLETTGLIISLDRIIELSYLRLFPDGNYEVKTYLFNPEMKIPKESSEVHGIKDEDVQDKPKFRDLAGELFPVFSESYLSGFNIVGFDLPMLKKEFVLAGFDFEYDSKMIVDAKVIFHEMEKRDLSAAYKFYCQKEHKTAHSAEGDVLATFEILAEQFKRYDKIADREFLKSIHSFKKDDRYVDSERKFFWRNGEAYFNFGKYRNTPLKDVLVNDEGFLDWMLRSDFSPEIKEIILNAKKGILPYKNNEK